MGPKKKTGKDQEEDTSTRDLLTIYRKICKELEIPVCKVFENKLIEVNDEEIQGEYTYGLEKIGVPLLLATTFLEQHLAPEGHIAGPAAKDRLLDDISYGLGIAKEVSRLDIGQTVVVRNGTVLAVEGFDGTDATIRRGGELGKGKAVVVKVSKPRQDMRFDVPVVGPRTLETAAAAGVTAIAMEAGRTLLLDSDHLREFAVTHRITLWGTTP
jgi:DUF1009 family protein